MDAASAELVLDTLPTDFHLKDRLKEELSAARKLGLTEHPYVQKVREVVEAG